MKLALDCWYELWNEAENRSLNSAWLPGTGASGEKTLVPRRPNKMASWRSAEALRSYEKSGGGSLPPADVPLSHVP
jgi:hypothetical protein